MATPFQSASQRYDNNNNNNNNSNDHEDDSVTTWGRHEREEHQQRDSNNNNNNNNNNNSSAQINNNDNDDDSNMMQPIPQQDFLSPSSSSSSPSSSIRPSEEQAAQRQLETPVSTQQQLQQQRINFSAVMSPMTQTLNVLSQNMDDLRYDAAVTMLRLDHAGEKSSTDEKKKEEEEGVTPRKDRQDTSKPQSKKSSFSHSRNTKNSTTTNSPMAKDDSSKRSLVEKENNSSKVGASRLNAATAMEKTKMSASKTISKSSRTKISSSSATATTTTITPLLKPTTININRREDQSSSYLLWKDYQDKYLRQNICIEDSGSVLGMRIQTSSFGTTSQEEDGGKPSRHCRVLKTFGLAAKYGIQEGDYVAWPMEEGEGFDHVRLALFETVQKWAKERPFCVCILRKKRLAENTADDFGRQKATAQGSNAKAKKRKREQEWIGGEEFGPNIDLASTDKSPSTKASGGANNRKHTPLSKSKNHPMVTPLSGKPKHSSSKEPRGSNSCTDGLTGNNDAIHRLPNNSEKISSKVRDTADKKKLIAPQKKDTTARQTASQITPTKPQAEDDSDGTTVAPYCLKCNKPKGSNAPRMHHAWCPHNAFFDKSGAKEIYQRMQNGLRIGCLTCKREHKLGKSKGGTHSDRCVEYYKKLKEAAEAGDSEDSEPEVPTPISKVSSKKKPSVSAYLSFSSSSDESEDEADDASCYRPLKKKQKIHTISLIPSNQQSRNKAKARESDVTTVKKHSNKKQKTVSNTDQKSSKVVTKKLRPKKVKKKSQAPSKAKSQKKQTGSPNSTSASRSKPENAEAMLQGDDEESESRPRLKDPLKNNGSSEESRKHSRKLRWIPCEDDPWGPPGHVDGDVLLYGPQEGIPHQSFIIPSQRFALDPFTASSLYRNTHCTPEEGYSMLSLRREPLGRRPWGMKLIWDEFGHACLIGSVDPLSPATAATYVGSVESGSTTDAGLRVNDMVLSVNGKLVGGMTEIQLGVELKISGPNLLLVVSRYKHASHIKEKFFEVERRILHVMDSAARDDRLIGWTEIGNGAVNSLDFDSALQEREKQDRNHAIDKEPARAGAAGMTLSTTGRERFQHSLCASVGSDPAKPVEEDRNVVTESPARRRGKPLSTIRKVEPQTSFSATTAADLAKAVEEDRPFRPESTATVEDLTSADHGDGKFTRSSGQEDDIQSSAQDNRSIADCSTASERLTNDHAGSSSKDDHNWENDDNAWNGCVCGRMHGKTERQLFWIQCDNCDTWYDVSAKCVGFTKREAENMNWTCWGCPLPSISGVEKGDGTQSESTDTRKTSDPGPNKKHEKSQHQRQHQTKKRQPHNASTSGGSGMGRKTSVSKKARMVQEEDESTCPETPADDCIPSEMIGNRTEVYIIGALVYVKAHSWPGKNCQGGIGHIVEGPYEDESGDASYTVKYTVGSTEKCIEVEYISPFSFEKGIRRNRKRKRGS